MLQAVYLSWVAESLFLIATLIIISSLMLASVGLFLAFCQCGKSWKEKTQKIISTFAGATFGVYLIHEHVELRRSTWKTLFHCESYAHSPRECSCYICLELYVSYM